MTRLHFTLLLAVTSLAVSQQRLAAQPARSAPKTADLRLGHLLASKAFRAAAKRVRPSLVAIETFGGVAPQSPRAATRGLKRSGGKPGEGPTTGIIVSADGYVLTSSYNLITRPPIITVIRQDGSRHVAKLVGRDDLRKICLLKVADVKDWPVPKYVSPDRLHVGQWAITVGLGYGKSPAISAGIISAKDRISGRAVQTDANISPANYGGPLLDIEGHVIGICVPLNPKVKSTAGGVEWYNSGIGFAIPLADAGPLIAALKKGQTPRPAALGVRVKDGDGKLPDIEVLEVADDSAAAKAGLQKGDRLITLAGRKLTTATQLRFALGRCIAGQKVELVFQRAGERSVVEVELDVGRTARKMAPMKRRSAKSVP